MSFIKKLRHVFLARFGLWRSYAKNLNFWGPGDKKWAFILLRIFRQYVFSQISITYVQDELFPGLKGTVQRDGSGRN